MNPTPEQLSVLARTPTSAIFSRLYRYMVSSDPAHAASEEFRRAWSVQELCRYIMPGLPAERMSIYIPEDAFISYIRPEYKPDFEVLLLERQMSGV